MMNVVLSQMLDGCRCLCVERAACYTGPEERAYGSSCIHLCKDSCLEARRASLIAAVKEEIGDWERVARILAGLASGLPGWSDKHRQEVLDWAKAEVGKEQK